MVTAEDYRKTYRSLNTGLVGSQLKLLIANRKLIFIGYSFGDEDFTRIYSFVRSQLSDFMNKPYVITLDEKNNARWRGLGLEPIYTSGEYFLSILSKELESKGCLITNETIHSVTTELHLMITEHHNFAKLVDLTKKPESIFCLSYQDGIIHALSHFLHHLDYGESLCKKRLTNVLLTYENLVKKNSAKKRWFDVAYLKGYLNGYTFVIVGKENERYFPRYLDLGLKKELRTLNQYRRSLRITEGRRKSITDYALRFVNNLPDKSLVIHHPPFL